MHLCRSSIRSWIIAPGMTPQDVPMLNITRQMPCLCGDLPLPWGAPDAHKARHPPGARRWRTHKRRRWCKQVLKWHKAQQTRRSRETQARLNALKLQDYSSYLELAAQAKDSRLREVIHATEAVMDDLILKVRDLTPPPPQPPAVWRPHHAWCMRDAGCSGDWLWCSALYCTSAPLRCLRRHPLMVINGTQP